MADKTPKRPKARQAAAAAESGKPVKLKKNFQNEMSPADRIRYYLGLPQGYPMNPGLIDKAMGRLGDVLDARGRLTDFEGQVMEDVISASAAKRQDERFEDAPGVASRARSRAESDIMRMASDESYDPMFRAQYGMRQILGAPPSDPVSLSLGLSRSGPEAFPSQEAASSPRRTFAEVVSVTPVKRSSRPERARAKQPLSALTTHVWVKLSVSTGVINSY